MRSYMTDKWLIAQNVENIFYLVVTKIIFVKTIDPQIIENAFLSKKFIKLAKVTLFEQESWLMDRNFSFQSH